MLIPNKVISFEESVLAKIPLLTKEIEEGLSLINLYQNVEKKFSSIDQFMYTIDILFCLNYLDIDEASGKIINVN